VNGDHISRFSNSAQATYYLSVLLLQLSASSLVAGAGLHVGLANFRSPKDRLIWLLGLPAGPLEDAARITLLAVPLFLLGSCWEFPSPLN
jgi:hypothetical protein